MKTSAIQRVWRQQPFNMIEIVLALVIIVIGIIGVIGLFPVSQEANVEARGRNYAGDASEQFMRVFAGQLKQKWALANTLPLERPDEDADSPKAVNWQTSDSGGVFNDIAGVTISYNDEDNDGKYDYSTDSENLSRDESGVFRLTQTTAANVTDFEAILRVWKTAATYKSYDASSSQWSSYKPVPPDAGVTLNVEISWPSAIPYASRQKSTYMLDVYRPTENEIADVQGSFQISESGKLRFTYFGSEAGLTSGFFMLEPTEKEIFASNKKTAQNTTVEVAYESGTTFNFFTRTYAKSWGMGTYDHYASAEDLVECNCTCRKLGGELNINPNNSPHNEFTLIKGDGSKIMRDDLHAKSAHDGTGVFYEGKGTYIRVKPKGNGNQNGLTIDGKVYALENKNTYVIESEDMDVRVYNDKVGKTGRCMGHWWLSTGAGCATVRLEGEQHDTICPRHHSKAGTLVANKKAPFYYDWARGTSTGVGPDNARSSAYDYLTGNPYCITTEMVPGRKWLVGFEDLPGDRQHNGRLDWIDWDYDDIVVQVELLVDDGVSRSSGGHAVAGTLNLNPSGNKDWRFTITKPDGTVMPARELSKSGYKGPAISIWARPKGPGAQTLRVDDNEISVNNEDMISVASYSMTVNVYKTAGKLKAEIEATDATFTVMN